MLQENRKLMTQRSVVLARPLLLERLTCVFTALYDLRVGRVYGLPSVK